MSQSGYYRYPTIHGDQIAFVCEDDLWIVSDQGGAARRLTASPGMVSFPKFSPDGASIAFTGRDDGPNETYVIPAEGGTPTRLSWFGSMAMVAGWSQDGNSVVIATDWRQPFAKTLHLVSVPLSGGHEPSPIPVGPARAFSWAPNGAMVVGRNSGDPARWKRYKGGTAGVLWIDRNGDGKFEPLIKLEGNLANPMWIGDRIFFLADHEGFGNLYSCTPTGRGLKRHTHHEDFYARFPSTDGNRIVYHAGADLYVFDPATDETQKLDITVPSSRSLTRRKFANGSRNFESFELHPKGHSLAIVSRGGLFTMGLWEGAVTRKGKVSEVRYRLGAWLPDGEKMVAIHDAGGEESLVVFDPKSDGEPRVIRGDFGRATELLVQPLLADSNGDENGKDAKSKPAKKTAKKATKPTGPVHVVLANQRHEVILVNLSTGRSKVIAHTRHGQGVNGVAWSPDGKWIAYGMPSGPRSSSIYLYQLATGKTTQVTGTDFIDGAPSFDPGGRYLYFISHRVFDPIYDAHYFDLGFPKGSRPYLVPLANDTTSPFSAANRALRAPSAEWNGSDRRSRMARRAQEVKIDLEGIGDRVLSFPVPESRYTKVLGAPGRVFFSSLAPEGSLGSDWEDDGSGSKGLLEVWDFESNKCEKVHAGMSDFALSMDRQTMGIRVGKRLRAVSAVSKEPSLRNGDSAPSRETGWVDLDRIRVAVEPRLEWGQMFDEAWRLQRDQFWTETMSGHDWNQIHATYRPLVERVSTRAEFSDLIWELQGELGTSHCYEMGGDYQPQPSFFQGFLGADLEYDRRSKSWKVRRIPTGDSWDPSQSSPIAAPGIHLQEGDEILAIGGEAIDAEATPYERLLHQAGQAIELTVRRRGDKKPVSVTVQTLRSESMLRYRDWVESNRRYVHEASKGKIGYVHVPNMGPWGYSEFHRYFKTEVENDGLLIDVRFNGGGHVSQILLEKLLRKRIGYDVNRWGEPESYPSDAPRGPIVALTNEFAGSDGDMFSHAFKLNGIGPLIGKRTWGGVVGIWPRHFLVDGTVTTQPEFAFWFQDVEWGIENYGTDPDIEVEIRPQDYAAGEDPQLDRAITELTKMIRKSPPKMPAFKNRPKLKPKKLPKS
ncbi:MAG: PDZ domain-containing protein [Candidatus Eisenbacteria bacterium]|nr:PDZ domain-containing protein [Candidatus Eisenbacteria bacterium]